MKFLVLATSLIATVSGNIFDAAPKDVTRRLEDDMSWMNGYTVMYENCFHTDNVVSFRLCPEGDKCEAGCSGGGEYVIDLNFFVDAFTEAQMGAHEYKCEMVRENCEYDDEDVCYQEAGMNDCVDANEDENGFDVQEWMECNQLDDNYYVGPYCSEDNFNIYLGVFTDAYCTTQVSSTTFYDTYGYVLPYSNSAIIAKECANCREHAADQDQNGGDDADDEDDVLEQCEELYWGASKCEENLDVDYPDVSSCNYISELQSEESVIAGSAKSTNATSAATMGAFIGLGVVGLMLCCCCAGWMYFPRKRGATTPDDGESNKSNNLL
mmetsp:Transcript_13928/g.23144  ORF Transcript_13928/g.23144 Transcript_13928/m.23144 type:complete len:324 (+) Transcript_13928:150-1121(+)